MTYWSSPRGPWSRLDSGLLRERRRTVPGLLLRRPPMNLQILIDNIVRQTTVLIAQLATSGGARAPLAQIANQVFLELARELESQGISRKVSADMFGLALRSYRRRIQQLSASSSERGRSLWEAMLDFLGRGALVTRSEIIEHFRHDDEAVVRGILHDQCESGLVFQLGTGREAAYRAATNEELRELGARQSGGGEEFLWLLIYREGPVSYEQLDELSSFEPSKLDACLKNLVSTARVEQQEDGRYTSRAAIIPVGSPVGWEAAMFDHYQAMVKTLCARLREGTKPRYDVGGSTYSFNIWPGHPLEEEVAGALREFRKKYTELRQRVQAFNGSQRLPEKYDKVILYGGQCVVECESEQEAGNV